MTVLYPFHLLLEFSVPLIGNQSLQREKAEPRLIPEILSSFWDLRGDGKLICVSCAIFVMELVFSFNTSISPLQ